MIDINDIDPSNYKSFYLTTFVEDFKLYQYTSGGLIEYLDYDKYTTDSGILIAFKSMNEVGTDFNYIAKNETKEELVDYQCYENIYEYIEATDYVHNGTIAFFDSVHFPSLDVSDKNKIGMDMERRCDKDATGPRGFVNSADGVHSYAFDKEKVNDRNVTSFTTILSVLGDCHLVVFTSKNGLGFGDYPMVTSWSSSLFGCLKMIEEWNGVSKAPFFNTEPQAIKANIFIEKTGMTEDVLDEIRNNQINMSIYSYITNPNDCRIYNRENVVLPEKVKNWIKSRLRYRTLSSLLLHNPVKFTINETILEEEKKTLQELIFFICILFETEDLQKILFDYTSPTPVLSEELVRDISHSNTIRKFICIK
jgi:hypothetical protein